MRRQRIAVAAGAALLAGLGLASSGVAQADTGGATTTEPAVLALVCSRDGADAGEASGTPVKAVMLAEAPATASEEVLVCDPANGEIVLGMPAAQFTRAAPASGNADGQIAPAAAPAVGVEAPAP